jgi:hypothetical protein
LRIGHEQEVAHEKSESARNGEEFPRSELPRRPKEEGKERVELDKHGEIPPSGIEIIKIVLDIDEAQAEQAQKNAAVDFFKTGGEGRKEIDEMRHPIHRVKAKEPRPIPIAPFQGPLLGLARS